MPANFESILFQNAIFLMVALFGLTFLIGSVPWGLIISKIFFNTDIRSQGSGNIGTTNALRTVGKRGGAAVFALDFGKGLISGYLGLYATNQLTTMQIPNASVALTIAFLGCVWGHIFSPWLGFKGGKGIAVAIGCLFFTFGIVPSLLELAIFIVAVAISRYVSLGSILAAAAAPFFALYIYWGNIPAIMIIFVAAVTILWAHRTNIKRLLAGNENKLGSKSKVATPETQRSAESVAATPETQLSAESNTAPAKNPES